MNLYYLGIKVGYLVTLIFIIIYYILSLETLQIPFYSNDKNKTIHLFDLQSLKSAALNSNLRGREQPWRR